MPIDEKNRTIIVKKSTLTELTSVRTLNLTKTNSHAHLCSYCSKSFSSPSHLSRHKLIHTGEKPCLCSECGQQFSQISSLERHQRTKHRKEKQNHLINNHFYQCKLCHEYFSLKHNLKMHEKKLHENQTNFFCNICSAYFTCNSSLQKHRNFRHRTLINNQISNNMSDNLSVLQNDQICQVQSNDEEQSFYFSSHLSSNHADDSINSTNHTSNRIDFIKTLTIEDRNKQIYQHSQDQQIHYQILKCNEII